MKTKNSPEVYLSMKKKKDMNVGTITLLKYTTVLVLLKKTTKLLTTYSLETKDILYVLKTPSMNPFPNSDPSVVPSTP